MRNKTLFFLPIYFLLYLEAAHTQDLTDLRQAKITLADFDVQDNQSDSGTGAIILSDIGKRTFEKNEAGDEDIVLKRFIRVRILNKNGLDAGTVALHLNTQTPYRNLLMKLPDEGLVTVEGTTYNKINGTIEEVRLDQASVISQQEGKNWVTVKFAMPALREGSIFDVGYVSRCSFRNHDLSWSFQYKYPCLWSEYDLTLPDADMYSIKYQGDSSFFIHTVEPVFRESADTLLQGRLLKSHFKWVKKNEAALGSEPYIKSINNYEDRVSLYHKWFLSDFRTGEHYTSDSWEGFSHLYYMWMGMEDFEEDKFAWLKKDMEQQTTGLHTKKEISIAIFKYVRDNFKCTSHYDYFLSQKLKETFKNKSGNVADLNLLLTAMLKQMHIEAYPAVLTTVDRGYGNLSYPLPGDYNYLICVADVDGVEVLLDASQPLNAYGKLPGYCYNGGAVTLNSKKPRLVSLTPDSLLDQNRANVMMVSDDKGAFSGSFTLNCGSQMSYDLRKEIEKTSLDKYLTTKIKDRVSHFSNEEAGDLKNPDKPLTISSDIDFTDSLKSDLCYIKPVVFSYFDKNPFSAVKRKYIIEMPYRMDNVYLLSLDIPRGYTVEEMPASTKISLNGKDGYFEYILEKNGDIIQLQMRIKIDQTLFTTEEYGTLREFINQILKKENEQIVFKKLK
ncbi:MAG TPA: DUF3858 domain-containing protein [Puia sp.]|nr:DUF3858 domain-containing protein [Puia sp.]